MVIVTEANAAERPGFRDARGVNLGYGAEVASTLGQSPSLDAQGPTVFQADHPDQQQPNFDHQTMQSSLHPHL